jgi:hypothetical protein
VIRTNGVRQLRAGAIAVLVCLAVLSAVGCRSAFMETSVENDGATAVHVIEVDYPSASFGMQTLDPHATFHYHFKIQGSGPITITFIDSAGKPHTATGPTLTQGQQGNLKITIGPSGSVSWSAKFSANGR